MDSPPPREEEKNATTITRRQRNSMTSRPPEPMAQTYAVLEKHLHDFESQLFIHAPATDFCNADSLRRKLAFLRSLLSAEMDSHPGTMPKHLHHVAARFELLEDAFNDWAENDSLPDHNWLDNLPPCSCTESCFEEAVDNSKDAPESPEVWKVEESEVDSSVIEDQDRGDMGQMIASVGSSRQEHEDPKIMEKSGRGWCVGGGIAGCMALLLTAIVGIVNLGLFQEEEFFLVPT